MDTSRTIEPRTAAMIIGAIVVAAIVFAIALSGGDDDDSSDGGLDGSDPTLAPQETVPTEPAADGPQVPPIDCNGLLTQDEIDEALAVWDRSPIPSSISFEGGEACSQEFADDPTFFVRIEPGAAADFLPAARLDGVAGEPATGVGDGAAWFGVDGGDGVGVLSVRQSTPVGVLVFRVAVGRPDVDDAARREIATTLASSALPRFPEVEVEQPDPTVVTFEKEPVDRSDLSFVDNLLTKEEAGEWTRGEGLVDTLRLFAGETEATVVLRHGEVVDTSGTGVIRLARDYEVAGPDDDARSEITRLLDQLVPAPREPNPTVDEPDQEAAFGPQPPRRAARPNASREIAQEPDCVESWFGLACLGERRSITLEDMYGSGKYRLLYPEVLEGEVAGWAPGDVNIAVDAMEAAAIRFETLGQQYKGMPSIVILLTPFVSADAHTDAVDVAGDDDVCQVSLNTPLQALPEDHFKQRIAAEMAFCLLARTFPGQSGGWWHDAMAIYLSGVVFPEANLEHKDLPDRLASIELETTLLDRRSTNWVFFEHLDGFLGPEGIFDMIATLPPLSGFAGIEDLLHTFEQGLTDISIPDLGPGVVPYGPEAWQVEISGPTVVIEETLPFGVYRMNASVESGKTACVEYDLTGELAFSWRPEPGTGWTDLPDELTGESMYLVTATKPGAGFTMTVKKVTEDECEEEEDPGDAECFIDLICGPSGYFVLEFEVVTIN